MNAKTTLWYMIFVGFATNYMPRVNMNIAIVSMVLPSRFRATSTTTSVNHSNDLHANCNATDVTYSMRNNSEIGDLNNKYFDWDQYEQNQILGAYFWLHWATQLPGGILAHHFGTKLVFGVCNAASLILCFAIPIAASIDYKALVTIRVLQGAFAGATWPSMNTLISNWVPVNERSKFVSAYYGCSIGTALNYFLGGIIISRFGWEVAFYITGLVGVVWYVLWLYMVYDTPEQHPFISKEEQTYITNSITDTRSANKLPIPWKDILTSFRVWITVFANFGITWSFFTLMAQTPTYLKAIHKMNIELIGLLSAIPHVSRWIFSFVVAVCVDHGIKKKLISLSGGRKIATIFATIVKSITIALLAFNGSNTVLAVTLMIVSITLDGASSSGSLSALLDLSPNFSSVLFGISKTITVTPGFISPMVVALFTNNNQTEGQWQKVFMISSVILFITGIVYVMFGSSEVEIWNSEQPKNHSELKPLASIIVNDSDSRGKPSTKEKPTSIA